MLLVNVNTKQFIPSAGSNFIQPIESRDQIVYGTRVEVRFQLYNPDGTAFVLNESDTFCCAGDINFIHTDDLMFYAGHEMCRIIDAAQGIVGVTIDATSDSFADKATSQNTRMYVQLKRHVAGDTLGDTVLQDIVYAQPAVMTTEGAPASSDPEYMTAAATLALLRTAPDYQFSADGEAWHDQQDIAADRFYRERRSGGEWGAAIELIEGKTGQTGAAAGFGTPTIAVETRPAGSEATASVTASGDDTAKVFGFSFGIPRGADGQNGTDGVSNYTYVAYASDASGAGFSLTPSNALKFRAEIHTATAIETPDTEDFAGATWVKYLGDDGASAGDMTKSVYDTNDDGIVDHAATADTVGATTAAQVSDAVSKAHTHANKATLDKLAETGGKLTYNGAEIGGASNWNDIAGKPATFPPSAHNHAIADVTGLEDALQNAGSVKSVNGQLPDESGNVTVETGGTVDESRLLKVPTSADEGKLPVIRADKIPAVYHDTTLVAIVIEGDKVIDKISGKELTKVGSPQIIDGGIHSPTNSDYYMLELEGVEGLPVAVSFDYQGDESPDNSDIIIINGTCSYYNLNGVSFCRTQGGGNNVKIDNEPIGVSEVYRNYVIQVSSDNYESKTPPVAFIAGESKSPTYEGSFPDMSPLESVKVCGRFGKIKNILISSVFPYTGNFTPRGDGVEGFGIPEKQEPGWNYETLGEIAGGELALKSDLPGAVNWHQLSGSSTITLDRANGELQKVTLTQNCTITAPTLDADHPTMLLQVTSASAVTVTVGETNIATAHTGTFQVGWFYDGETTRRYPVVEVA